MLKVATLVVLTRVLEAVNLHLPRALRQNCGRLENQNLALASEAVEAIGILGGILSHIASTRSLRVPVLIFCVIAAVVVVVPMGPKS